MHTASRSAALLFLAALPACSAPSATTPAKPEDRPTAQDVNFPLADFTLTERSGRKVSRDDLNGKVWVSSFVFTRCTGPCPQVTATMARLQAALAGEKDVRLVTFTVDPARDDPDELRKYADTFRADKDRWLFLTGKEEEIHKLLQQSFKVGVARNEHAKPGDEFSHSTRLAVVDKKGNVRAYYQGQFDPAEGDAERQTAAEVEKIKDRVAQLLAER